MVGLERKFGLWTSVSIVVGSVIGSSIFMVPASMATQLGSPIGLLLVWMVAGFVSLFGGMINAEIGSKMPVAGGQYVYLQYIYGDFIAYLYGWAGFIVVNTAAIAGISFVFAQYTGYFFDLPRFPVETEQAISLHIPFIGTFHILENIGIKILAISLIVLVTVINVRSVKAAGAVQVFFSILKVMALLLIVGIICYFRKGDVTHLTHVSTGFNFSAWSMVTAFIAASTGALAAYDGWNNLGFVAGEIKNPQRNIPFGLFIGIGICILMYVMTTEAFMYMLPINTLKNSDMVATDALFAILGPAGAGFISLVVIVSCAGAANGNILPCARITYAMSEKKQFFHFFSHIHPVHHTPSNALWLQATWSSILVMIGSFGLLMDMFVFVTWIFYAFAAFGIFVFRKKMPDVPGTYKMKGYPLLPLVFIAFAILYVGITLFTDISNYLSGRTYIINSVFGLLLTLSGIPFYWYFKKEYRKPGVF